MKRWRMLLLTAVLCIGLGACKLPMPNRHTEKTETVIETVAPEEFDEEPVYTEEEYWEGETEESDTEAYEEPDEESDEEESWQEENDTEPEETPLTGAQGVSEEGSFSEEESREISEEHGGLGIISEEAGQTEDDRIWITEDTGYTVCGEEQ